MHREAAWEALAKDIAHGAVRPCDLRNGKPVVVSPVRTAPKGWRTGKRRFVVNMRHLNTFIPDEESSCSLDTLSKIRNLFTTAGDESEGLWGFTIDLASGYHNFAIAQHQLQYMGIAVHACELPPPAISELRRAHPHCEDRASGLFYFTMLALPFGLASSCAIFSDIITALAASWRRHKVCGEPVKLTSYIDDCAGVMGSLRAALVLSIELTYEVYAAGLTLNDKCRPCPARSFTFLGLVVDTVRGVFRLPTQRALRLSIQTEELATATRGFNRIEARTVAQFLGLLWSASLCCPRAVAIMTRGIIDTLAEEMRYCVYNPLSERDGPYTGIDTRGQSTFGDLKRVLSRFWNGTVEWSRPAARDLHFWLSVNYYALRAPISSDASALALENSFDHPYIVDDRGLSYVATDASGVACGGGLLRRAPGATDSGAFSFVNAVTMVSELPQHLRGASSALREAITILWLLRSLAPFLSKKIVVFTDSRAAAAAIRRGTSNAMLREVVVDIFLWCARSGSSIFPCWVPRSSHVIQRADALSRIRDTYDATTPPQVFLAANKAAVDTWGRGLSFDRQASHLNVMSPPGLGPKLRFNSLWLQPGSAGVDMFLQPRACWRREINFIHPARPTIGRTLTFVRNIGARAVIVFPISGRQSAWWTVWTEPGGPGVVMSFTTGGFRVVVVDHSA